MKDIILGICLLLSIGTFIAGLANGKLYLGIIAVIVALITVCMLETEGSSDYPL